MSIETLKWKGMIYEVKPFTLGNYYSLIEGIADGSGDNGLDISLMFENTCKALLKGTTVEAQSFLNTGNLTKSILDAEDESELKRAFVFKEEVDKISANFTKRANDLAKSAPDLTDSLTRNTAKSLNRSSRKDTKEEPAHSG